MVKKWNHSGATELFEDAEMISKINEEWARLSSSFRITL